MTTALDETAARELKKLFFGGRYALTDMSQFDEFANEVVSTLSKFYDPARAQEVAHIPLIRDAEDGPFFVEAGGTGYLRPVKYSNACALGTLMARNLDASHIIHISNNRNEVVSTYVGQHARFRICKVEQPVGNSEEFTFGTQEAYLAALVQMVQDEVQREGETFSTCFFVEVFDVDDFCQVIGTSGRQNAVQVDNGKVNQVSMHLPAEAYSLLQDLRIQGQGLFSCLG